MSAIKRAIKVAGGLTELAKRIGVSPQVVANWRARGAKGVPAERVLDVERATIDEETGAPRVTRHDIRSDLYPRERAA